MAERPAGKEAGTDALANEPIPRLVLRFTAATLTALLLHSVYNLTDALFVSWGVGSDAMGGVSVAFPFVLLQGAVATAVGGGAASIVSRRLGQGRPKDAGAATLAAMLVFYATAALTTVLGLLFLEPMLHLMGVTGALYPYARQYLFVILLGNVFSTGFSSIIRAEGKMLYGLLIWVVPITLNIALDAALILGLGLGVLGSALATVASQFLSFCMSLLFFWRFSAQQFHGARIGGRLVWQILSTGFPSLVQMGSLSAMSVLLNNVLRQAGGTLGVTTYAYISRLVVFASMPFTAFAQALAPIVGYNHGVGNTARARGAFRFCVLLAFAWALPAFVLFEAAPGPLLRLFTTDADIVLMGTAGLRVVALSFFLLPLPLLSGAAFQAVGSRGWALILYAAGVVFMVPAALVFAGWWGVNGVWWAYVAGYAGATALALIKLLGGRH